MAASNLIMNKISPKYFIRKISFGKGITVPLKPFRTHKLHGVTLPSSTTLTKTEAVKYFTDMTRIRVMENVAQKLYMEKAIKGFCHLYSGQEACCVGVEAVIDRDDSVITAYRSHGWTYTRGAKIVEILCELTGRVTGCSKGKGGSMHTYAHEFYGGNGIVGAQVPLGSGIALAHKMKNNGRVCVTLYGDGAANQGQVFEAFNMAALWKLPVIYMCENNQYGMGTSKERAAASSDFYSRGDYIPGIRCEGNCILSVREATRFCYDWVKTGKGPIVVELNTYRYSGHSMSDPGTTYRTTEEVQSHRKSNDPISSFVAIITQEGLVTNTELEEIREKIEVEVDEAREHSLEDPFPSVSDIGYNVYVGGAESGYVRGCTPFIKYDSTR